MPPCPNHSKPCPRWCHAGDVWFVSIQGMQILARVDFANNEHNFLIAAVSIAAGVGPNNSNLFVSMPTAFQMFFSNGIVVASLLAIVLRKGKKEV